MRRDLPELAAALLEQDADFRAIDKDGVMAFDMMKADAKCKQVPEVIAAMSMLDWDS
jgi:hypothetical protein